MKNWDDLRYFLAVARKGSIRGAAAKLGVNHSTVSRRIDGFEKKLGVRLFERMPSGYLMTQAGEEMLRSTERIETEVSTIGRRVVGGDARLSGLLRVTLHDSLAQKLLMPDLVLFCQAFPEIELELLLSDSMADLARREADVAIRISNDPTDNLFGRRVLRYATAIYGSDDYLASHSLAHGGADLTWVGWNDSVRDPQWVRESPYPNAPAHNRIFNPLAQVEAVKSGMGLGMLPCFLADPEPTLRRLPPANATPNRDIWILTHEDLRHTARVRKFLDFMAQAMLAKRDLLEGRCPRPI
ncbi:MAG TPA: LysR family transcriptional regulator [Rhodospirillales bacterium]|nr:LysR family transcriptional regulator [Rhodospirillales bacterium]